MDEEIERKKKMKSERNKRYYLNKGKLRNKTKEFLKYQREWRLKNIEKCNERARISQSKARQDPVKRQRLNEAHKKWRKEYPERARASQQLCDQRRRMKKYLSNAILTTEEKNKIKEFYIKCPKGYHVDHIIPISKGGEHMLSNLQYLTASDNLQKRAKWIGVDCGEWFDPNYLLNKLKRELDENEELCKMPIVCNDR